MSKPRLLIADSGLAQPWFMPYWAQYFDCGVYQRGQQVADDYDVALVDDRYEQVIYNHLTQLNLRIARPYLMDTFVHHPCETKNGELILRAQESVWIQESIQFSYSGYNTPRPTQLPDRFFLLLINRLRDHRQRLFESVTQYLSESLYTCVHQGIMLPDDVYEPGRDATTTANDRLYVPRWYAETGFSLVSETQVDHPVNAPTLFISEKIFKPLAHSHPFVVNGCSGTLSYLQDLGFETFAHRIDETYDQVRNPEQKLQMILSVLDDLYQEYKSTGHVLQDARTKEILAHNQALFFDSRRIEQLFQEQIVNPILEFIES